MAISSALPLFEKFPAEAAIIGRLMAGYGELEFELAQILGYVLQNQNRAIRALYRVRTEANRIDVAQALIWSELPNDDIKGKFSNAIGALYKCKAIRNAYAHCHWLEDNGNLLRTNMEDFADKSEATHLKVQQVKIEVLKKQEAYYAYTIQCLIYVTRETHLLFDGGPPHQWKFPKKVEPPPL